MGLAGWAHTGRIEGPGHRAPRAHRAPSTNAGSDCSLLCAEHEPCRKEGGACRACVCRHAGTARTVCVPTAPSVCVHAVSVCLCLMCVWQWVYWCAKFTLCVVLCVTGVCSHDAQSFKCVSWGCVQVHACARTYVCTQWGVFVCLCVCTWCTVCSWVHMDACLHVA